MVNNTVTNLVRKNSQDTIYVSHIQINKSGVILGVYLLVLEIMYFLIGILTGRVLWFIDPSFQTVIFDPHSPWLGIGLLTVKVVLMFIIVSQWLENSYEISPGKIIFKSGVFHHHETEYDFALVTKADLHQDFFGRLLNYGTIKLCINGTDEKLYLANIADPQRMLKIIKKALVNKKLEITLSDEYLDD